MSLLQELLAEKDVIDLSQPLREAAMIFGTGNSHKVKVPGKNSAKYTKKNPKLPKHLIKAAVAALDSYSVYKKSKNYTTRLHANDEYEKRMFKEIVKILTGTGKYKVKKSKIMGSTQWYWELERKHPI